MSPNHSKPIAANPLWRIALAVVTVAATSTLVACAAVFGSDPGKEARHMIANHEVAKGHWKKVADKALQSDSGLYRAIGDGLYAMARDSQDTSELGQMKLQQDESGLEFGLEHCEDNGVKIPDDWASGS